MVIARDLRAGQTLRIGADLYRILSVTMQSATAQLGGVVRATARNLRTGHVTELRWTPDERLDDVPLEHAELQFLYADPDEIVLMHPETYEQFSLPRAALERYLPFLKEGALVRTWLYDGQPVDLDLPKTVPLVVASCGAGLRGAGENTMKEATLENGIVILVPQFIQPGDTVLVDVETREYLERVRRK
ncbi:MAG TPA: elongation factor P [Chloroflexota bacterium]|nr:elongation factor P [Chloroflexota bacterium]